MDNEKFITKCKQLVADYANENFDKTDQTQITMDDVFVVWSCKTLQNNKALLSTTVSDGMYYELTYNGDKSEIYFDAYKKWENKAIKSLAHAEALSLHKGGCIMRNYWDISLTNEYPRTIDDCSVRVVRSVQIKGKYSIVEMEREATPKEIDKFTIHGIHPRIHMIGLMNG